MSKRLDVISIWPGLEALDLDAGQSLQQCQAWSLGLHSVGWVRLGEKTVVTLHVPPLSPKTKFFSSLIGPQSRLWGLAYRYRIGRPKC